MADVTELKPRGRKPRIDPRVKEIFDAIEAELAAQDEQWGEQNHPLQGGRFPSSSLTHYEKQANSWKTINDQREKDGVLGWDGILIEETFEALAEDRPERAVIELVQVAAVAVQAILSLHRNQKVSA